MNLHTTIEILAGGPGSGRHPYGVNVVHEKVGSQKGSNAGGEFIGSDGVHRYVKFYSNPQQGRGEALANGIYRDLGIGAPKSDVHDLPNGKEAFASEIIKDKKGTLEDEKNPSKFADEISKGFAADVLVGNWDVVGLTYDNILIGKDGGVNRIDNGGSFLTRAQGAPKPDGVLNKITEWEGLFNPSVNREFSSLMKKGGIKSAEDIPGIKGQVKAIVSLRDKSGGWDKYISSKVPAIKGEEKTKIVKMLDSRTKLLQDKVKDLK